MNNVTQILIAIFASGGIYTLAQFLITRYDNKKNLWKMVDDKIDDLTEQFNEYRVIQARVHILRFSDDLKNGIPHSQEFYRQLLMDIDLYDQYTKEHPDFKNGMTVMAAENIKKEYSRNFLTGGTEI